MNYVWVFVGGGIGAMLRHAVNGIAARHPNLQFPWGTFFVNVTGSLVMGLVAGYLALRTDLPASVRLFLATGILGGYTTFSAFSLEAALLIERGQLGLAASYVLGSVALSIGALFAGLAIARVA